MIHFLFEGGNSDLKGRYFPLGKNIRKHLEQTLSSYEGDKTELGYKRLNNLLAMKPGVSYEELKRIKNFFDNYNGTDKSAEYILNGGDFMKLWVDNTLNTATSAVENWKEAKKEAGVENAYRKTHEKNRQTKPQKPKVAKVKTANVVKGVHNNTAIQYESKRHSKIIYITEEQSNRIKKKVFSAASYIFAQNENGEWCVLGGRRSGNNPNHSGGKYDVPVGRTEPGENPIDTACRETVEETGINIPISKYKFVGNETWKDRMGVEKTGASFVVILDKCLPIGKHDLEHDDVRWIPIKEVGDYSWEFGMNNSLLKYFKTYVER